MVYIHDRYKTISREDIIRYLSKKDSSLLTGFLLSMIWGHGYAKNGRADNIGPWKVSQMLGDVKFAEQVMLDACNCLKTHDVIGAHGAFEKMKRCRVNFFSKFLYFLGRALEMPRYPLIFDRRVAQSIFDLCTSGDLSKQILEVSPKQDAGSYGRYVDEIHAQAEQYHVDADKIEYFLYRGSFKEGAQA